MLSNTPLASLKNIHVIKHAALVICLLFSALTQANEVETVQRFISSSGLGSAISGMPDAVKQQFKVEALARGANFPIEKVSQSLDSVLADLDGYAIAEQYLLENVATDKLQKAIEFSESELGQRIVAAELQAYEPGYDAQMQGYIAALAQNPPSAERTALIQRFIKETDLENISIDMIKTMLNGMMATLGDAAEIQNELQSEWKMMEGMLKSQMAQYLTLSSYYTYRDISNEDFSRYIDYCTSEHGNLVNMASVEIFKVYVSELMSQLMTTLIEDAKN